MRPLQRVCSPSCALTLTLNKKTQLKASQAVLERKEIKKRREQLKSRRDWWNEAQAAFNAWIRWRDRMDPCISCARHHDGQYHAGHYRSRGAMPMLAMGEDGEWNTHKQCAPCNNHKSGNVVEYRIRLLQKIGPERLSWLEGPHEAKHYTIDDLKAIKAEYKRRLKDGTG